jgi:hypothetical protein
MKLIKPEFVVNGLEFSVILSDTYTWDEVMSMEWTDGWRVPKKWQLMMLYEEKPESYFESFFWADSPVKCDSRYAWGINLSNGRDYGGCYRLRSYNVRLVRAIYDS